jgi:uncharacterized protein (DUF433 family)
MAARYPLNLPVELKREAEEAAKRQGVSLNQFILWSVAEKVTALKAGLDDPDYPNITYRRGASGIPVPIVRGTGIRVQTLAIAHQRWGESEEKIAAAYDLLQAVVSEALEFYQAHKEEIDLHVRAEDEIEKQHADSKTSS